MLWIRLPLEMVTDHVNVWALDDGAGWTLVDTGLDTPGAHAALGRALATPRMAGKPVTRVIATHHHPDHVGQVARFSAAGAELWTTRSAWLNARMLHLDARDGIGPETEVFWRRAGMAEDQLARLAAHSAESLWRHVGPLPPSYRRIAAGDEIVAGGRRWHVATGHGHAPEHAVLFSLDDDLVIGGDQMLPSISANIGVLASEPEADPIGEWLDSLHAMAALAEERHLVLPGHGLVYRGLPLRLEQMIARRRSGLDRLRGLLGAGVRTVPECFPALYRRPITDELFTLALSEAVAHLNHLARRGQARRDTGADGLWRWSAV
uniref:MBL fold metallo-hydrolase n=1 Tax=Paenirhodobacter enshiensis TaxID=1105367 RepID=UPI0035AEFA76